MHPIIYDVAVSIDGYIAGPEGDVSKFAHEGPVVDDYNARLADYAVAIMGRSTYEFGYQFGMKPGQNPYSHMRTRIFSRSLELPVVCDVSLRKTGDEAYFEELKTSSDGPIYLCGGGAFAGSLMAMGLIDYLRLKRAPVILGGGTRLFGNESVSFDLNHSNSKEYHDGYVYQEFKVLT